MRMKSRIRLKRDVNRPTLNDAKLRSPCPSGVGVDGGEPDAVFSRSAFVGRASTSSRYIRSSAMLGVVSGCSSSLLELSLSGSAANRRCRTPPGGYMT